MKTVNDYGMNTRRDWGTIKPYTKVFKSKKNYNRKDKSWKKEVYF